MFNIVLNNVGVYVSVKVVNILKAFMRMKVHCIPAASSFKIIFWNPTFLNNLSIIKGKKLKKYPTN